MDLERQGLNVTPGSPELLAPTQRVSQSARREGSRLIVMVLASLMAALASVTQTLLPMMDTSNLWLVNSTDSSACLSRAMVFRHLIPTFLHLVGLVHVRPRELLSEWYIKPRTRHRLMLWIDDSPWEDTQRFREFFRIGPALFFYICEMVHDDMVTDPPRGLIILPNRKLVVIRQVALALRRLAVGDTFLTLGELFGVSKSSAVKVTWKFICAIRSRAGHVIRWPDDASMQDVKAGFQERWDFPNCCGAVDGTHFPIELPAGEDSTQYYDWKHKLSVSMQAICDQSLRFLDVCCGLPGSIQDTRLMRLSRFYTQVTQYQSRLNGPSFQSRDGTMIQEYIIGDAGYPLLPWLVVPYPKEVSQRTDDFNYMHSSTRMCVERSFGKLKGTWRILSRSLWKPRITRVGPMIYACCILHNLIIDRNDGLPQAVWHNFPAHPPGYAGVLHPNLRMYRGGPEGRDAVLNHVLYNDRLIH